MLIKVVSTSAQPGLISSESELLANKDQTVFLENMDTVKACDLCIGDVIQSHIGMVRVTGVEFELITTI